jgi:hypothetical protein
MPAARAIDLVTAFGLILGRPLCLLLAEPYKPN